MPKIIRQIAAELKVQTNQVQSAVDLLDGGATVPFIARYRKEAAGGLLAVAGNEGNGGAAVEQVDGRLDLVRLNLQFGGDLADDFWHASRRGRQGARVCHSGRTA